jgi:hypothetical protein
MKKYPLIGRSIIAVVLLVLGSLTNVVGYQSVKSTTLNESPLFKIRTQKATNQQQNILTSQYLGKGKGNLLYFPMRDNRTELLKRVIEYISKMDDKTFARFTALCIQKVKQDKTLNDTNPNEILQVLRQLKIKPEIIINSFINRNNNNNNITSSNPGYILLTILYILILIIVWIIWAIGIFSSAFIPNCLPSAGPPC